MHKLLSRTFAVLALVAVVPAVAFASTGRIEGLGVPGDYVKDFTGTRTYLSGVTSVGNLIWVNPSDNAGMGAVLQNLFDGRFGTFAININETAMGLGASTAGDWNNSGESLDLTWGHKMGTGSLGVRFNRSYESFDGPPATEGNGAFSRNIMGFGAGYGWSMNANTDVEVSALYQSRTFDNGTTNEDGGVSYLVSGRAMMKAGSNLNVTPVIKMYSWDLSTATGTTVASDKITGWSAGVAGNWALGSSDLFVFGCEFSNDKEEAGTNEAKVSAMPAVFMGLESSVNNWLTLRFGAGNTLQARFEANGVASKFNTWYGTAGAGVKVGSFQFDATMNPAVYDGAVNEVLNGTPFSTVSATYSF
jgi:hypothetical protein